MHGITAKAIKVLSNDFLSNPASDYSDELLASHPFVISPIPTIILTQVKRSAAFLQNN